MNRLSPKTLCVGGTVASAVLYALFVLVVPAGAPYDEPSHFSTVEFYASEHRLPVLGDPGVTYEAQMGPVYYGLAGGIREAGSGLTRETAFYLTRFAGLVPWMLTLLLTFRLGQRLCDRWAASAAVALVGLNPALLAVVSSVQNDGLAIALCTGTLLMTVRAVERRTITPWVAVGFGVLAGVAVLTKLHAGIVSAACLVAILASMRRERVRTFVTIGVCVAAITGWWFVRNHHLYGDLTGRNGISQSGVEFAPADLQLSTIRRFGRGVFAYLWTPAEYYRNLIDTPRWYEATSGLLFVTAAVGTIRARVWSRAGLAVTSVAVVLVFSLAVVYFTQSALGGRYLYPLSSLYALALVRGFRGFGRRVGALLVGLTLLAYSGYSFIVLADVHNRPKFITFS